MPGLQRNYSRWPPIGDDDHESGRRPRNRRNTVTERVVLAYSGGLDTSVAIEWIKEETGAEVIAVAADVGQGGEDLRSSGNARSPAARLRRRSPTPGPIRRRIPCAGVEGWALYMDVPAGLGAVRPLIVVGTSSMPLKPLNATIVAHTKPARATIRCGSGVGIGALAPDLRCIARCGTTP